MVLSDAQARFVSLAMLAAPVLWLLWNTVTSGKWRTGLMLLAGASLPLLMGWMLLCGQSLRSRTLYREGGRVAFVDHHEAALFDVLSEPVVLPAGVRAYLKEEVRTRAKKHSGPPTYPFHVVYLGAADQAHPVDGSRDRAEAQALVDQVNGLLKGETSRLELAVSPEHAHGGAIINGVIAYALGLVVSVGGGLGIGGWTLGRSAPLEPGRRLKVNSGPRSGRSNPRGWKKGR